MRLRAEPVIAAMVIFPALAILAWTGNTAAIEFTDVAQRAGIRAELHCGGPEKSWIPEANGTGAAWLDYDNDGLMDLLIVNGSSMEQLRRIVAGRARMVSSQRFRCGNCSMSWPWFLYGTTQG